MAKRLETVFVAEAREINDDGSAWAVTLNTTGETRDREALLEAVSNMGVNPNALHEFEDKDIGTVMYDENDRIQDVTVNEELLNRES